MTSYDKMEYVIDRLTPAFELNNGSCDLIEAQLIFRDPDGLAKITMFVGQDGQTSVAGTALPVER